MSENRQERVQLLERDVLQVDPTESAADIILAMNFSYLIFKTRDRLRAYFSAARAGLADDGLLMLDGYGGHDSWRTIQEKTKCDGFTYLWDQRKFNPITFEVLCHMHFKFPDGSKMKRAFTYDWRMWTLPEIREVLTEAGFSRSTVYWEGTDEETGEGNDNLLTHRGRRGRSELDRVCCRREMMAGFPARAPNRPYPITPATARSSHPIPDLR